MSTRWGKGVGIQKNSSKDIKFFLTQTPWLSLQFSFAIAEISPLLKYKIESSDSRLENLSVAEPTM